ncbi:LutC/YkgG family protein [Desulfovirgula thermocuniculi]|uniref:LutC/YkgG family protein n=1 Tax=Desulfovirgula thermocuniculi TaxID=348842 RepID=UPI00047F1F2B|nr:lactate utilization protein [Desulfovirgula thermocuniculi]
MSTLKQLYEEFVERARAVGTEVHWARGKEEARQLVGQVIKELKATKVALAENPFLEALGLKEVVRECGAELTSGNPREQAAQADLGISSFTLAVAETGTIVQDATDISARLVSMLPPCHLALVPAGGLVATLREAIAFWARRGEIPGYLAFVSGPSRTADIERVLTIGVHGPARVVVIFVEEGDGEL